MIDDLLLFVYVNDCREIYAPNNHSWAISPVTRSHCEVCNYCRQAEIASTIVKPRVASLRGNTSS